MQYKRQGIVIESYSKTELREKFGISYFKTENNEIDFIPIRIVNSQTRQTEQGYQIRYIKREDYEKRFLILQEKNKNKNKPGRPKKQK